MAKIKEIVDYLDIPEKRLKAELNRPIITSCNVAMSNMAVDQKVAIYAYKLDLIQTLLKENNPKNLDEIKKLREELESLKKNSKAVREYQFVADYKYLLESQISEYYKAIQIDLRKELISERLPEIYVNQGTLTMNSEMLIGKHIIIPGTMMVSYDSDFETTIYPESEEITSARSARHFYNQVSFKYLEQLTEDYSYDLEGKDLGKVKVLKRG